MTRPSCFRHVRRARTAASAAALSLVALALSPPAAAQPTWTGLGISNGTDPIDWSNPYNWQGNSVPGSGNSQSITFASAPTGVSANNLGAFSLNLLTFNTPVVLSGSQLSFQSYQFLTSTIYPGITQSTSGPVTIQNNLALNNGYLYLFIQGTGTGTLTLSGAVSGASALDVTAPNNITVLSNGGNSYTGGTIVSGNVRTDIAGALPAGGAVSVISGTLNLNGTNQSIGGLYLSNASSGAAAPAVQTGNGILTLGGDVTYSPTTGTTFGSYIGGNLNLGGATRNFNIGAGDYLYDMYVGAQITGSGGLTKTGAGFLEMTNQGNAYTGATAVQNGTLFIPAAGALPPGTPTTIQAGTLNLDGTSQAIGALTLSDPSITSASPAPLVQLGSGTLTLGGNVTYNPSSGQSPPASISGGTLNLGGATRTFNIGVSDQAYDTVISASIAGSGGLTKTGSGILALTSPASYSGPTTLSAGFVYLAVANALPSAVVVNGGLLSLSPISTALGVTAGSYNQSFGSLGGTGGSVILGSAALTVGTDNTSTTYAGAIAGSGSLVKVGSGTLTLTGSNNYTGGTVVTGGTVAVAADSALGAATGPITINPFGTLNYTGTTITARPFTLNLGTLTVAANQTLTLQNTALSGGYLAGPGSYATVAGGNTAFAGGTLRASAALTLNGSDSLLNFSNSGQLSVAAGRTASLTGVTNQGSGSITIGATSPVSASDFQTYGTLTINPATVTETYSQTTLMTNVGTSPLYFNGGSRTFLGTASTAVFPSNWSDASLRGTPTFVAGIDLNGKNAVVAGGLLVNNGYVEDSTNNFAGTAAIVADFGSLVKGSGYFQNSVQTVNGGKFQAGNSPGMATFGKFVLGPGGVSNYVFAIDDATGAAGPSPDAAGHVSGWGLVKVGAPPVIDRGLNDGDFTWTATAADKLTVGIETLVNPTTVGTDVAGPMDHFDPTQSYSWPAVEWTGSYAGPADAATLDASTAFDLTGFANPVAGTFGWALDMSDNTLSLTYSPSAVPEPGTLVLLTAAAGVGLARRRLRRHFV